MDYRNSQGEELNIPPKVRRRLWLLRPLGIVLCLVAVSIPLLMVLKVLKSTIFGNYLSFALMFLGPVCYLIGFSYDTYVDRKK
jgi:hypothetical protein